MKKNTHILDDIFKIPGVISWRICGILRIHQTEVRLSVHHMGLAIWNGWMAPKNGGSGRLLKGSLEASQVGSNFIDFQGRFRAFVHNKNNQPSNLRKTVGEIYFSPRPKEHQFSTHVKFDARTPGGSHLFLRISPKDSPVWVIRRRSRRIRKNFLVQHVFWDMASVKYILCQFFCLFLCLFFLPFSVVTFFFSEPYTMSCWRTCFFDARHSRLISGLI